MKTRVLNYVQLCLTVVFCLSLSACNKEDYYEKEFLDNPYQENPTTEGPVGDDVTDGDNDVDGGAQGGADSGVGGTSGSATDGSTSGGTNGGTTGGTTGGTNGGTTGGTDGGTTGGTDGGTTGGADTGPTPQAAEEIFHQASSETKKLDIVWIIDNSGSMADEQTSLGANFNAFIQDFISKDVDFKMAITTTDTRSAYNGLMVSGSESKLNSMAASADPDKFMEDFKRMVKVGTSGSGSEKGLEASEGFMQRYSDSFLRTDAYLAVVIVSDEEDQSPKTPKAYADYLKSFKQEAGLVKIYSIVDSHLTNSGYGVSTGFERYAAASSHTAGTVSDIRDDFYHSLTAMGDSIINLLDSFALASDPVDGSLKVFVDGALSTYYTYDSASRSIKFDVGHLPAVGAEIKVQYLKL